MLEKEFFRTPSFSLKCNQGRLKKSWVFQKGVKSELIVLIHIYSQNMPPHYSFIFTTDLTRNLWAHFSVDGVVMNGMLAIA